METDPPVVVSEEERFPGVRVAFEFVIPSYEMMERRLNAVEGRIQGLLGLSATLTVAAPLFLKALDDAVKFTALFWLAIAAFVLLGVIGTLTRTLGVLQVVDPNKLLDIVKYDEWEFKKNSVDWAGANFKDNKKLVDSKGWAATLMTVLFIVEALLLALWTSSQL